MDDQGADRAAATGLPGLRGRLSDVYFPTLLDDSMRDRAIESLATRLGPKATVDDPVHGRATGLPAVRELLSATARWLADHGATYERHAFVQGIDRDATDGALAVSMNGKLATLPVALVAELRKSREVELRIYLAAEAAGGAKKKRGALVPASDDVLLPSPVGDFVEALATGNVTAMAAQLEEEGSVRDALGATHAKRDGGLRRFLERIVADGGVPLTRGGAADDARVCAFEYTGGRSSEAGAMVFERGDSGLLRSVRLYGALG